MKLNENEVTFLTKLLNEELQQAELRLIYTADTELASGEKHQLNYKIQKYVSILTKLEGEV